MHWMHKMHEQARCTAGDDMADGGLQRARPPLPCWLRLPTPESGEPSGRHHFFLAVVFSAGLFEPFVLHPQPQFFFSHMVNSFL